MTPEQIRDELNRRGMSQRDLADAAGMSEDQLSKSLAGRRQFKLSEMDRIRAELASDAPDDGRLPIRSIPLWGMYLRGHSNLKSRRAANASTLSTPTSLQMHMG